MSPTPMPTLCWFKIKCTPSPRDLFILFALCLLLRNVWIVPRSISSHNRNGRIHRRWHSSADEQAKLTAHTWRCDLPAWLRPWCEVRNHINRGSPGRMMSVERRDVHSCCWNVCRHSDTVSTPSRVAICLFCVRSQQWSLPDGATTLRGSRFSFEGPCELWPLLLILRFLVKPVFCRLNVSFYC